MVLPKVVSIGEILVDFIPNEIANLKDLDSFQKCPGGAPANFIVGMARLGIKTAFVGKVGDDPFGEYLRDVLYSEGVNVTNLVNATNGERTTLAFVYYDNDMDRDFFFYRNNSADINLTPEEIDSKLLQKTKYLHFGSLSLTEEPVKSATFRAINLCKENNGQVCFDPNIRADLWKSEELMRETIEQALEKVDIFLPSLDELQFLYNKENFEEQAAIEYLFTKFPLKVVAVKKGKEGCIIKERNGYFLTIPSFEVDTVDTTGAGDGFDAGFIFGLLNELPYEEAGIVGNAIGALVVQKKGAMTSLPFRNELEAFFQKENIPIKLK